MREPEGTLGLNGTVGSKRNSTRAGVFHRERRCHVIVIVFNRRCCTCYKVGKIYVNRAIAQECHTPRVFALDCVQNHIETEKLTVSLLIACHHPGGKKSMSPGPSTEHIAYGTTSFLNSPRPSASESDCAKTSRREVLLMEGFS